MRQGDTVTYLLGDHLGSTSVTADSSGTQTARQTYFPFGAARTTEGTLPTDYTFTGQKLDASSNLMYYGARYYDASLGRFAQPDSLVPNPFNPQDLNRYSNARNNPLRYTDSTGHFPDFLIDIAFLSYDVAKIQQEGWTVENSVALAADLFCAFAPIATGGGPAARLVLAEGGTVTRAAARVPEEARIVQGSIKIAQATGRPQTGPSQDPGGVAKAREKLERNAQNIDQLANNNRAKGQVQGKPIQDHHLASNKNDYYWTSQFESITDKYGLGLDDKWNHLSMPHIGRHADAYHQ